MNVIDLGMDDFFIKVEEIEKDIEKISKLLKALQDLNEKSKTIAKASGIKAIQKLMENEIDKVKNIALAAKSKIEDLDIDNINNRIKQGCMQGSSVDRSRITTTIALKNKWKVKVLEFQTLRESIEYEYREVVKRTIFTVTGNYVEEKVIDHAIQTGKCEEIYQKVIQDQGRGQIMDTLADIQHRHESLKEIEKKLLDLQQVFLDMSILVEVQGEMLDNIESQVSSAAEHVQVAITSINVAKKKQKNKRKLLFMALILILLVIIIVIILVIKPWKHK